mmetsp:Transcript_36352/g.85464  ORF Transcript_36352/g.85464 Transcript_36352/m.85464 type:complete len:249 (-) Transcript_36352:8-754(-)|eukprot:CAMPEP_0177704538 /NCGR_PEP_ID=MMETSP0484_2-20121128/8240_1 /TAXON_ID=354590 /ORGANISM="Rhodomonas lens, Strain RHODO" /LENGTH=248 /DNA_ID=CAMNT_0019215929 /DNA_START=46 /DNA_END=792 /DNA_ORIENTATION=+
MSSSILRTARTAAPMRRAAFNFARGMATGDKYARTQASVDHCLKVFDKEKACAVLRVPKGEWAAPAMDAAIAGGFKIVEFTLTTPGCLDRVAEYKAKDNGVMVGCGTVMNIQDAKDALDAGSDFLVAPVLVPEVVKWCAERNVVIAPGCYTPTELYTAHMLGAQIQKLFPGVHAGPGFVKAVTSALPMLRLNPTSGVDKDNVELMLKSGAASVGLVAPLFDAAEIAKQDWDAVNKRAVAIMAEVNKAK